MGTWNFGYDSLNRLVTATVGSNAPAPYANNYGCWSYDDFGNRTAQSMSTTPCADNPPLMSWAQYNGTVNGSGNNQMSATNQNANQASGYDAAGDVINDGVNQYLYDGEGRICAVASTPVAGLTTLTGYIYDADGTRVSKGTLTQFSCDMNPADSAFNGFQPTNDYILGPAGEQAAEMGVGGSTDGSASSGLVWLHTNIWAGGTLLGTYDGGAGIISADSTYGLHFYFNDPLGTRRVQTDYAGVVEQTCQSLPYGDGETCAPTPTENLFTGKERDAETNNDYFDARYYRSALGRFMTPDWSAKVEPVPYAKMGDPQSLNLYAYMMNNPLGGVDADGHNMDSDFVNFMSTISTDPGLMRNLGYSIGPQYGAIAHATAAPQVVSVTSQLQCGSSVATSLASNVSGGGVLGLLGKLGKVLDIGESATEVYSDAEVLAGWKKVFNAAQLAYNRDNNPYYNGPQGDIHVDQAAMNLASANEEYLVIKMGMVVNDFMSDSMATKMTEMLYPGLQPAIDKAQQQYNEAWSAYVAELNSGNSQ